MTDEREQEVIQDISPEETPPPAPPLSPLDANEAALEKRFEEPVLKGEKGIDTAQLWIGSLLIFVVGVLSYSNAFLIPFHDPDIQAFVRDTALHRPATVGNAFAARPGEPLTLVTYALNWMITPFSPAGLRSINILLHLLNSALIFLICRELLRAPAATAYALAAGMVFATHPLAVDAIAIITGRAYLLATFFTLASVWLFLLAVKKEVFRAGAWLASIATCAFAMLSSPAGYGAPLFVLTAALAKRNALARRLNAHAPYWAILGLFIVASSVGTAAWNLGDGMNALGPVTSRTLALLIMPVWMSAAHGLDVTLGMGSAGAPGGAIVLALIFIAGWVFVFRGSLAGVALVWFSAGLAAGVMSARDFTGFTERQLYLSLTGAVLLLPWAIDTFGTQNRQRVALGVLAVALILGGAGLVFMRNHVWQDELTVWRDAAAKAPDSAIPLRMLGTIYLARGEAAQRQAFELEQKGEEPGAAAKREEARGDFSSAESYLRRALELCVPDSEFYVALGAALQGLGSVDEAIRAQRRALELDFQNQQAALRLATLYETRASAAGGELGALRTALDYYQRAAALGGLPPAFVSRYANALATLGDIEGAEAALRPLAEHAAADSPPAQQWSQYRNALQNIQALESQAMALLAQNPDSVEGLRLAGQAHFMRSHTLRATYVLERALRHNPRDYPSWNLLGMARAYTDSAASFVRDWPAAPAGPPNEDPPWTLLARQCVDAGLWEAALAYLKTDGARAEGVESPLVRLAEFARERGQAARAQQFLNRATEESPDDPAPWLGLCDFAMASANFDAAQRFLDEAERRNADPKTVEERRGKLAAAAAEAGEQGPREIIMR